MRRGTEGLGGHGYTDITPFGASQAAVSRLWGSVGLDRTVVKRCRSSDTEKCLARGSRCKGYDIKCTYSENIRSR